MGVPLRISLDAMGGDAGPSAVVAGIAKSAAINPEIGFILHGPEEQLRKLVARRNWFKPAVLYGRPARHVHTKRELLQFPTRVICLVSVC